MWKQLLRVRPVGELSSLAVSESLGGLHPKASKCFSEDESQGVNDPKVSKTIPDNVPCSLRDCEGTSPARKICTSFKSFCLIAPCELSLNLFYISLDFADEMHCI
jgi:hypothetical protein